ncbi:hypothetical protein [Burkholderia metallica]|uniref:hypothetical protein n=1 Tax=Burkholderia metallica TaxID=488729 RepID=UPI001CF5D5ED|nr:hypothetical protein [Burkholderia metallica]MCA8017355.1 hypothetical protein [Burkholderia metallica]
MMAGIGSRSRARPVARVRSPDNACRAAPLRLPAGVVVAAHLAGIAAGIAAIAALAMLLALMFR